tara:strand:- start:9726 stop:9887 length:162 start_codon:yes stop_codon:yes gene_type:complete
MKRLIGVKELRTLLESENTIYETMDTLNNMARKYARDTTIEVMTREFKDGRKK